MLSGCTYYVNLSEPVVILLSNLCVCVCVCVCVCDSANYQVFPQQTDVAELRRQWCLHVFPPLGQTLWQEED